MAAGLALICRTADRHHVTRSRAVCADLVADFRNWFRDIGAVRPPNCATALRHGDGMCLQCDGYSFEQSMLSLDLTIRTYGWQLNQVTDANPWSYTIGLTESYGHPELMSLRARLDVQNTVIRKIVDPIVETGSVDHAFLERARGHAGRGAPEPSRGRLVRNLVELLRAHPAAGFLPPDRAAAGTGSASATGTRCPTSSCRDRFASDNRAERRRPEGAPMTRWTRLVAQMRTSTLVGMEMTTSALRRDIYRILDRVIETGEPVDRRTQGSAHPHQSRWMLSSRLRHRSGASSRCSSSVTVRTSSISTGRDEWTVGRDPPRHPMSSWGCSPGEIELLSADAIDVIDQHPDSSSRRWCSWS